MMIHDLTFKYLTTVQEKPCKSEYATLTKVLSIFHSNIFFFFNHLFTYSVVASQQQHVMIPSTISASKLHIIQGKEMVKENVCIMGINTHNANNVLYNTTKYILPDVTYGDSSGQVEITVIMECGSGCRFTNHFLFWR